ncbi:hypothetical protein ER308_17570 [Egibacter rhizosphaerae]|uniref:DUF4350 domain-containing protein n=1 Tax=Egibacter rhizosphaerae TaxID=1670831 RepID=A0A411YJA0_9ACTN|nr:DUF4350 domain-containing protein [Egibacter rhizosphaerae]QBI21199.1 hypothetical protein ER308_17570 [Egibacter rhizosphaerae]
MSRRGWIIGVLLVVGLAVAGWWGARDADEEPLQPTSTGPMGTQAVVDVLDELGADVDVDREVADDVDAALLLADDLERAEREALEGAVQAGATLLVTDPGSELAAEMETDVAVPGGGVTLQPSPDCPVAAFDGIGGVRASGFPFEPDDGEVGCFPVDGGPWLVVSPEGEGRVVSVGSSEWLVNSQLTRADHAALAVAILLPGDEARVTVLPPGELALEGEGMGIDGVLPLVPGWVWALLAQVVVAALVVIGWRARRLGRPVSEPQPVDLPGSELVVAVGELLQVSGSAAHAARRLRADTATQLRQRLGLAPDAPPRELAAAAVAAGADPDQAERAFVAPEPEQDAELLRLARDLEDVRAAVEGHAPALT